MKWTPWKPQQGTARVHTDATAPSPAPLSIQFWPNLGNLTWWQEQSARSFPVTQNRLTEMVHDLQEFSTNTERWMKVSWIKTIRLKPSEEDWYHRQVSKCGGGGRDHVSRLWAIDKSGPVSSACSLAQVKESRELLLNTYSINPHYHPSPSPGTPHSSGETIGNCWLDRRQDWLRRMVDKEPWAHGPAMRRHRGRKERETRETQEPRGPSQVRNGGWGHRARRKCIKMRILNGIHEHDTALL